MRTPKYDFDRGALRPRFEASPWSASVSTDGGVFHAATSLYGITFEERSDLTAYHPDARVFEIRNADGGERSACSSIDLYTRDSKRGGAWMNSDRVAVRGFWDQAGTS